VSCFAALPRSWLFVVVSSASSFFFSSSFRRTDVSHKYSVFLAMLLRLRQACCSWRMATGFAGENLPSTSSPLYKYESTASAFRSLFSYVLFVVAELLKQQDFLFTS
jgi:hypothetical protein